MKAEHGIQTGTLVDRYLVEGVLGQGGMATVYKVRHQRLGGTFALKVLDTTRADVSERMLQEGRVQSSLRHPNVVAVSDVIEVHGQAGLVMELVEGPSLDVLIHRGPLPIEQVDALAEGIMLGVRAAHRAGTIHRDLKPQNILLAAIEGGRYVPKITDFGLAKVSRELAGTHTRTGQYMGTPSYAAPEQFKDAKNVDERADVFSLGAIFYEMLTGTQAFPGADLFEVLAALVDAEVEPPSLVRPEVPSRMETAILGALCAEPSRRIANVDMLLAVWRGERADVAWPDGAPTGPDPAPTRLDSLLPVPIGTPRVPEPRRRWRPWVAGAVAVSMGSGALAAALVALAISARVAGPNADPRPSPTYQPLEPAPSPSPPEPAPRSPDPTGPVAVDPPEVAAEPEPGPRVPAVSSAPPVAPARPTRPPKTGSVRVVDAGGPVWLIGASGARVALGDAVPEGTYQLYAHFLGAPAPERVEAVGDIHVRAGDHRVFKCNDQMRACRTWP